MIRVENMDSGDSYLLYNVITVNLQRMVPNPNTEDPSAPWIWEEYEEYASWRLPFSPAPAIKDSNRVGYHVEIILSPLDRPFDWMFNPLWENSTIGNLFSTSKYSDAWSWDPNYFRMYIDGSRTVINDVLANLFYQQDPSWNYMNVGGFFVTFLVREIGTGSERNETHELMVLGFDEGIFSILQDDRGINPEKVTISEADLAESVPGIPSISFKTNSTGKSYTDRNHTASVPYYLHGPMARKFCSRDIRLNRVAAFKPAPFTFKDLKTPENFKPQPAWLVPLDPKVNRIQYHIEERNAFFDQTAGPSHSAFAVDLIPYPKRPAPSLINVGPPLIKESEKAINDNLRKDGEARFLSTEASNAGKFMLAGAPLSGKRGFGTSTDLMRRFALFGDGECLMKPGVVSLSQVYLDHSILVANINGTKNGVSLTEFYKCSYLFVQPNFEKPYNSLFTTGPLERTIAIQYKTPGILLNTAGRTMSFGYRPSRLVANNIRPIPRINDRWNLMGITYISRICNLAISSPEGGFTYGRISGGVSHVKAVKFTGRING